MNISSDFFLSNQENPDKEEEDLRIFNSINHLKSNSKFQIEKYEKFKPKPKIEIGKIDSTILSAENKVKLLLSSFLHDLKTEQKNEEYTIINIKSQLNRKKTKVPKKNSANKKNLSNIINVETPACKFKKINTINGNKYYKNENKNNFVQSPRPFNKKKYPQNSKSLFFNSYHTLKDNSSKLKKNYKKKFGSGIHNILISNNIENFEEINKNYNIDIYSHNKVNTLMSDIYKDYDKYKTNSAKLKKYKKIKTKIKNRFKNSIKPVINNSFYSEFDLNSIIDEKLLKLTGDIQEGIEINDMLEESKGKFSSNNINNSNINFCSNFSDKEKSDIGSSKKLYNNKDFNKMEKNENINESHFKSTIYSGKENFNEHIQRTKTSLSKKKYKKINTLKDLKEQIKNSIILRPEELNLSNAFDKKNTINKLINIDKERLSTSKLNNSFDKNTESNISSVNQSIDKKTNRSKFYNEDEAIKNKINKNSDDYSDNENENENQDKNSFCSFGKIKTKKEIAKENFRVLIYKKLIYDSLDDEEIEEEINNKYIHPDSLFIKIFDNLVSFLSFATLIYMPYYLAATEFFCKSHNKSDFVTNIFVEIVYLLDFIFGFFKAYYNFEEQLITNNMTIIKRYLESWFLLDFISAFPILSYLKMKEPFCLYHDNIYKYDETVHNIHYLMVLNKLLKIFKVNFINHNFIQISNKLGVNSALLIQLLIFFSILHFFSCLHIFISRNSYPNWIIESKLENSKFLDIYISSVYSLLASITTVGYGDIVCHSFTERIFQIFLLIVGCLTYSWLVSSFSNYIKKINEKSVDFENRKQILDEISFNYPKMPNYLYERTLRYLKYKNFNEKKDKNMIFDCLPIGLKNNLVFEMYKPIIKNFIFFKNFGNTDFIVKVILAFKPILAYKNDVLLNEGDIVGDIFFVKKGILSVQIPINIKNPEEYIEKYLYSDIDQKNQQNNFFNPENQNFFEQKNNTFMNSVILQQEYNQINFLNITEKKDLINEEKMKEEEKERKKNTKYIKIVSIRENEHFGDVLMFIDQRSPLRVKVTSKKAELFFLKKMDVVKISSSYQNIWRRINKRSVLNFELIKKSIPKIVELYCKFKGFIASKIDENDIHNESSKKSINKRTFLPTTKLKFDALNVKNPKRSLSQQYIKNKNYIDKYFPNNNNFSNEYKNIKTHVIINAQKNFLSNSDSGDENDDPDKSSENSNISTNNSRTLLNKKLLNTYNRQYKFYVGSKEAKESTLISMIKEEPETDTSITPLKASSILKNKLSEVVKNTIICNNNMKKSIIKSHFNNNMLSKKKFDNINQNLNETDLKIKRLNMENVNENNKEFRNRSKSIKSDSEYIQKIKSNIVGELLAIKEENSLIKDSINDEFDINEEIKIPINESLRKKRISKSVLLDEKNIIALQKINKINKQKSEKILYSNKSLNKNYTIGILDKNNKKISNKKLNKYKKLIPENIIKDMQIPSIYNNLHSINNKYYLNKNLQKKIKQLLEEDTEINYDKNIIKKSKSIGMNKNDNKFINKSFSNSLNNHSNNHSNSMTTNTPRKNNLLFSSLIPSVTVNKNRLKKRVKSFYGKRSSTFSKLEDKNENLNSSENLKKKQKVFTTNIGDFSPNKATFVKKSTHKVGSAKRRSHNISRENCTRKGSGTKDNLFILNKCKNATIRGPEFFIKKRKTNLLYTINSNIEKNSQNINNPNEFYSNYFQSLLEIEKKNTGKYRGASIDFCPQLRKSKK